MKICYLIASCDKYSDLWKPFFALQAKYWKDCPYRLCLGTESKTTANAELKIDHIHTGICSSWTEQVLKYVSAIPEDIILFSLEDFFLRRPVDTGLVAKAENWFAENTCAASLRLNPLPYPDQRNQHDKFIGEYTAKSKYRISTQAAFWRKSVLIDLLQGRRSPWQFELCPPGVSREQRHFGALQSILPYRGLLTHHVVEKGRWIPHELLKFRASGLVKAPLGRPVMSLGSYLCYLARVSTRRALDQALRLR